MSPSPRDLQALTDEITTLCGHLDAAEYRLLELIRELDERAPWGLWEMKSCAHWLNWQCGIALGAAREKVRVAHALSGLPEISAAFREGRLSYSKVRAITRIASAENEASLVEIALAGTAAHIERIVRQYRTVERLQAADAAMALHESRSLTYYWAADGALVIHGRLPPEQGAVLIRALERAERNGESRHDDPRDARSADALALLAECYLSSASTLTNAEIDREASDRLASSATASARSTARRVPAVGEVEDSEPRTAVDATGASTSEAARASRASLLARRGDRTASVDVSAPVTSADRFQIVVHVSAETLRRDGAIDPDDPPSIEDGPALAPETVRRLACDASIVSLIESAHGEPLAIGRKTRVISPAMRRALKRRDGGCCFPGCTNTRFVDAHHIEHWADGGATRLDNLVLLCRHHHRLIHEGGFSIERCGNALDAGSDSTQPDASPPPRHNGSAQPEATAQPDANAIHDLRRGDDRPLALDVTRDVPHRLGRSRRAIDRARPALRFRDPHGRPVSTTAETRFRGNVASLFANHVERGIAIGPDTTVPEWYGERPDYDHILWVLRPEYSSPILTTT